MCFLFNFTLSLLRENGANNTSVIAVKCVNTYFHIMIQYIGSLILKVITMKGIVFFLVHFLKRSSKTREGEGRPPLLFSPPRARVLPSFLKTLAPVLLFQKLWLIHVSQNRCQKAYLLRLQSSTANSPFSNSKLPLNTNINDTFIER